MLHKTMCAVLVGLVATAAAAEQGKPVYVTADVGISSVRAKMRHSNGTGPATQIMQNQNWSGFENKTLLMAFDTRGIRGWTVSRAVLHLHLAAGELWGVGLCTILADWQEGGALNGVEMEGAPCWDFARTPARGAKPAAGSWWAWPGSKFFCVSWAHPAARYSHAGPGEIKKDKTKDGRFLHLAVPVDPKLVESLAAGVATGLVLTDDKGQVRESYSLIGPAYPYRYNAAEEAWVFTKDIHEGKYRPWLEVFGAAEDKTAPAAPAGLKVVDVSASAGSFTLEFAAPGDDGASGEVLAYEAAHSWGPITAANWAQAKPLPRWSLPKPVPAGKTQRMPVFTAAAGSHWVAVRGVDEAGNRGAIAAVRVSLPRPPKAKLPRAGGGGFLAGLLGRGSRARALEPAVFEQALSVVAVPDMVKVDPVSGGVLSDEAYTAKLPAGAAAVWDRGRRCVKLRAAANEVAAFQLILGKAGGALTAVGVSVGDLTGPDGKTIAAKPNAEAFRVWYVRAGAKAASAGASAWYGDACLPLAEPFERRFDVPSGDNKVAGQKVQSVWVDLYVPRSTAAGVYEGPITITAKQLSAPVKLQLRLEVLRLSLPDESTWAVELNRYHSVTGWAGVSGRDADQARKTTWDYHRLAHKHRCVLIVLPYSHSGRVDGTYIPVMEGTGTARRVKDWSDYDKLMGPLLDGSAFSAGQGYVGPGAGLPLHHMYTPFHEAWPMPIDKTTYADWMDVKGRLDFAEYAKKSRRPEVAFSAAYKKGFTAVARQWFEHFQAKGWTRTTCHLYNNNKYYWKVAYFGGMGRGGACFWLMDEPTDFDDYDANAFIMGLGLAGYRAARARDVKVAGRVDVSQPEMTRGLWDGVAGVWCVGGFRGFATMAAARRRWLPDEEHTSYGGGSRIQQGPVLLSQACLQRWSAGFSGWMPWWNCFGRGSAAWTKAEDLAIYYTGRNYAGGKKTHPGPIAGVRLKLARRCQQDIEYLHLLAARPGWDRHRVRRALLAYSDDPEAPVPAFGGLTLEKMIELRQAVIAALLAGR